MKTIIKLLWVFLLSSVIAPLGVSAQSATRLITIPNPTPAGGDQFGFAVATVGEDRLLIGARYDDTGAKDTGAAYLFGTNGTLLTTITNPAPAASDYFGYSVAAGPNELLVGAFMDDLGATDSGAAYLFSTNGALLTVLTNPTPESYDSFGYAVATAGPDRMLVSAPGDSQGAGNSGVAYLFNRVGAVITVFTNPTPAVNDHFGCSLVAVGDDRVLIGADWDDRGAADAGLAYLFNTNGVLLTTFTNPTPAIADYFGFAMAVVPPDRVLIGAHYDNTGASHAGAAYLFTTDAALLTTLTNPAPTANDWFGYAVAVVGSDHMVIGSYQDDLGANNSGLAYVFDTNGTLLTTITNPTPAAGDCFGKGMAAAATGWFVIGAPEDSAGAFGAGTVHLFTMSTAGAPVLSVTRTSTNTVVVSWTATASGWLLHAATNLVTPGSAWTEIAPPYQTNDLNLQFIEPSSMANKFYRLHKP